MVSSFFTNSRDSLHIENLYGENNHHIIESCFKGLARALREAVVIDPRQIGQIPSTKGEALILWNPFLF